MRLSLLGFCGTCEAAIALCATVSPAAAERPPIQMGSRASEVIMTKITVSNLRRSLDFYIQVAGLEEATIPGLPEQDIDNANASIVQVFLNYSGSAADAMLCLVKEKGVAPTRESARLTKVVFKVPDVRATMKHAKAAGAPVVHEVMEFLGAAEGSVLDPDGYVVTFTQMKSVVATGRFNQSSSSAYAEHRQPPLSHEAIAAKLSALEAVATNWNDRHQIRDIFVRLFSEA